jgi:hypothetical protein
MKNLSSGFGVFVFVFALMFGFNSLLFASDPIKIDTVLTDKVSDGVAAGPKDVFSTDTPIVYVTWKSDQVKSGQKIKSVWIADDTNNVAPANYKIDEAEFQLDQSFKAKMLSGLPGGYWDGVFQMSKPNSGWPAGKYHVDIYVDNVLAKTVNFSIAADLTSAASVPEKTPVVSATAAASATPAAGPAVESATAAAAKGWGAISVDTGDDPAYGVGGGDTKDDAGKNAQKFCASAGGKSCSTVLSYEQCGAYATSATSGVGKGTGATQKAAEAAAISDCKNADCTILTSDCNE